ncbi:MAG: TonB-dependent receptor, partial [Marinilabiliales bacterium]
MKTMNRLLKFILTFCAFMVFVVNVAAQGIIRGKVSDKLSGETLIGVTVIVEGSDPMIGTTTDLDGNFSLDRIEPGLYTLRFSYISYSTSLISEIK